MERSQSPAAALEETQIERFTGRSTMASSLPPRALLLTLVDMGAG